MAVREESENLLTEARLGGFRSSADGNSESRVAALWISLQELRGQFAKLAGAMDNLAALRAMDEEAALIEMALLAQGNATLVDTVWQALAECDDRARDLGANAVAKPPGGQGSQRSSWIPRAHATIPVPLEELPFEERPPFASNGDQDTEDAPAADRSGTHEVDAALPSEAGPITQVDIADSLRVLVVDDEPAVLRAFGRVLSQHYDVLTARNGAEALKIVLAEEQIDAIVCDLDMPRLNGGNFFAELRELKPQLLSRVVFCTGTAMTHRGERFLKGLQAPVLHKPVAAEHLLSVIESVLPEGADAKGAASGSGAMRRVLADKIRVL